MEKRGRGMAGGDRGSLKKRGREKMVNEGGGRREGTRRKKR